MKTTEGLEFVNRMRIEGREADKVKKYSAEELEDLVLALKIKKEEGK